MVLIQNEKERLVPAHGTVFPSYWDMFPSAESSRAHSLKPANPLDQMGFGMRAQSHHGLPPSQENPQPSY